MIITLENGIASAKINTLGAELMSFADSMGLQYIWQGDAAYWSGRAPVLFPIVGALRGGRTQIDGREYSLARHGVARRHEFDLSERRSDRAVFTLCADAATLGQYPYDFELAVEFELRGNSLHQSFRVTNRGDGDMPYCLGGHPAIRVPLTDEDNFEDYVVKFPQKISFDSPTVDMQTGLIVTKTPRMSFKDVDSIKMEHSLFYGDAVIIENAPFDSAELYSAVSGRGVNIKFIGFKHFAMWSSVNDGPFVCLEPWTSTATRDVEDDVLINKQDIIMLPAGETGEHRLILTQI